MKYLLDVVSPGHHFTTKLAGLLDLNGNRTIKDISFSVEVIVGR